MNPGISVRFDTQENSQKPAAPWKATAAFYLLPEIPEQSGDVIALTTTTKAYKRAVCRFFPIEIPASKHRDSTESSILWNAINLLLPAWCFHPEQIWAGGGPQECGPFAVRHLGCFGADCSISPLGRES
jgi:hypothetical protein